MDTIAEIRERFRKHSGAQFDAGEGWIRYIPSSNEGFTVELRVDDGTYVVAFEGWHERFQDKDAALNCFAFGLSDACRLKIVSRGGKPQKWIVESRRQGEWIADSETGNLLFAFWQPRHIDYRQNALVTTSKSPRASPL